MGHPLEKPEEKSEFLAERLKQRFAPNSSGDRDSVEEIDGKIEENLGHPINVECEITSEV